MNNPVTERKPSMLRKYMYHGLFIFNLAALFMAVAQAIFFSSDSSMDDMHTFIMYRTYVTFLVLIFLGWNIVIWSKRDKKVIRFLALFFLPGLYTLFYYPKVLKNNWLDK